jgi:Putative DNA-binding domain/EC042_2821-lke REase
MTLDVDVLLTRAREGVRESKRVEFKEQFNPAEESEWIELIKDFAAIANSGGGVIIVGLRNNGTMSGADVQPVLELDGAVICDKLRSYLGEDFDDFEISEVTRNGGNVAAIIVGEADDAPLTFVRPGTYPDPHRPDRQKSAFGRGVYFRHGAKSEPGTREDLRLFIDRCVEAVREEWLGGVRTVVTAPRGAEIVAIERGQDAEGSAQIRITTDESAPLYRAVDWDTTHPYRQTELIQEVSSKLPRGTPFNSHDALCIRRAHRIDGNSHPEFAHELRFGGVQYSEAFADWIVDQYNRENDFFTDARQRYYELTHPNV